VGLAQNEARGPQNPYPEARESYSAGAI
jgi:hypothetical protein